MVKPVFYKEALFGCLFTGFRRESQLDREHCSSSCFLDLRPGSVSVLKETIFKNQNVYSKKCVTEIRIFCLCEVHVRENSIVKLTEKTYEGCRRKSINFDGA